LNEPAFGRGRFAWHNIQDSAEYRAREHQYRSKLYPFSNPSITNENRFNTHSEELEQRIPSNALIESAPASALSC